MPLVDLCTLAEVKEWMRISDANSDAILNSLIPRCSQAIRTWLSRDLDQAQAVEVYDGMGTPRLQLRRFPITSVASVVMDGITIPAATTPNALGFRFDEFGLYLVGPNGMWPSSGPEFRSWSGGVFTRALQNVTVTYTAGYDRSGGDSLPKDIRQACIELVDYKYQQRQHVGKKTQNISASGQGTSYQEGLLSPECKEILAQYRRVVPV